MNDDTLQQINRDLEAKGLRTIEQFKSDAIALATLYSNSPAVLDRRLKEWQATHYNPEAQNFNIRVTLEFQRNALAKHQYRCDGPVEELQKTIDAIENGSVVKYFRDVLTARELVDWWTEYVKLYIKLTTKQPVA